ncbi:MAG: ABC transporter permease [Lachnospiraceae bacterium]|nr:ABC transporter permease [Lachnospiraceae bacterium]
MKKILSNPFVLTVIAIILGFVVASIILLLAGYPPVESIRTLVESMLGRPKDISSVIIRSTPIIFTGLGVAFAIKTGLFNIGAEGQYVMGCVVATMVGSMLDFPKPVAVIMVLASAMLVSALYAGFVGFLKAKLGIHEVITSIMLNWIALYFSNWVCGLDFFHKHGTIGMYPVNPCTYTMVLPAWKRSEEGQAFLAENPILKETLGRTDVNIGFLAAVIAAILITYLLNSTRKGFELRAVGQNIHAARFAGINVNRSIVHAMMISGALCGLGAGFYITGQSPHTVATLSAFENVGFNGLSVAFIAFSSPIGCIFAGLLFGGLLYGGAGLQSKIGAPTEIINIVIGVIVFFCALSYLIPRFAERMEAARISKQRRKKMQDQPDVHP